MFRLADGLAKSDGGNVSKEQIGEALASGKGLAAEERTFAKVFVTKWTRRIAMNIASWGGIPVRKHDNEPEISTPNLMAMTAAACRMVCNSERLNAFHMRKYVAQKSKPGTYISLEEAAEGTRKLHRQDPDLVFEVLSRMMQGGRLVKKDDVWHEAEIIRAWDAAVAEGIALFSGSGKGSGSKTEDAAPAERALGSEHESHYRKLERAAKQLATYGDAKTVLQVLRGLESEGKIERSERGYARSSVEIEYTKFMETHLTEKAVEKTIAEKFSSHLTSARKKWRGFKKTHDKELEGATKYGVYDRNVIMGLIDSEQAQFKKFNNHGNMGRKHSTTYADLDKAAGKLKDRTWRTDINAAVLKGLEADGRIAKTDGAYLQAHVIERLQEFRNAHWTESELMNEISRRFGCVKPVAIIKFREFRRKNKDTVAAAVEYGTYGKTVASKLLDDNGPAFMKLKRRGAVPKAGDEKKDGRRKKTAPERIYAAHADIVNAHKTRTWQSPVLRQVVAGLEEEGRICKTDGKYGIEKTDGEISRFKEAHWTPGEAAAEIGKRFGITKAAAMFKIYGMIKDSAVVLGDAYRHGAFDKVKTTALFREHPELFRKSEGRRSRKAKAEKPVRSAPIVVKPANAPRASKAARPSTPKAARRAAAAPEWAVPEAPRSAVPQLPMALMKIEEIPDAKKKLAAAIGTEDIDTLLAKWKTVLAGDVCSFTKKEVLLTHKFNQLISTASISLEPEVKHFNLTALGTALRNKSELMLEEYAQPERVHADIAVPLQRTPVESAERTARTAKAGETEAQEMERTAAVVRKLADLEDGHIRMIEREINYAGVRALLARVVLHIGGNSQKFTADERKAMWAFSSKVTNGLNLSGSGIPHQDLNRASALITARVSEGVKMAAPAKPDLKKARADAEVMQLAFERGLFEELKKGIETGKNPYKHEVGRPTPAAIRDCVKNAMIRDPAQETGFRAFMEKWNPIIAGYEKGRAAKLSSDDSGYEGLMKLEETIGGTGFAPAHMEFILDRVKVALNQHLEEVNAQKIDHEKAVAAFEETLFSLAKTRYTGFNKDSFREDDFAGAIRRMVANKPGYGRLLERIAGDWETCLGACKPKPEQLYTKAEKDMRRKVKDCGMSELQLRKMVYSIQHALKGKN